MCDRRNDGVVTMMLLMVMMLVFIKVTMMLMLEGEIVAEGDDENKL